MLPFVRIFKEHNGSDGTSKLQPRTFTFSPVGPSSLDVVLTAYGVVGVLVAVVVVVAVVLVDSEVDADVEVDVVDVENDVFSVVWLLKVLVVSGSLVTPVMTPLPPLLI